jgi:hypothetical protein
VHVKATLRLRAKTCSQALVAKSLRKQGGQGALKGGGRAEVMKVKVEVEASARARKRA